LHDDSILQIRSELAVGGEISYSTEAQRVRERHDLSDDFVGGVSWYSSTVSHNIKAVHCLFDVGVGGLLSKWVPWQIVREVHCLSLEAVGALVSNWDTEQGVRDEHRRSEVEVASANI
jgi:hypothetical protein